MDLRFAVLRCLKALDNRDIDDSATWLSDDLAFHTSVKTLNKTEIIDLFTSILNAFPDWEIVHDDFLLEGDDVQVHIGMSGTHTHTLALNIPGIKPVAATYKKVVLPRVKVTFKVENDQITDISPEQHTEANLFALFRQLGITAPPSWRLKTMWKTVHTATKSKATPV